MMLEQNQLNKIKDAAEEFFAKMTIEVTSLNAKQSSESQDAIDLDVRLQEPQILIGQQGQTLFEIQRLLRMILNKKLQKLFYLNLDINGYKAQKISYLKDLANSLADQVSLARQEKPLPPMQAYERRIIHAEISKRTDVLAESHGEGPERHIVIKPK